MAILTKDILEIYKNLINKNLKTNKKEKKDLKIKNLIKMIYQEMKKNNRDFCNIIFDDLKYLDSMSLELEQNIFNLETVECEIVDESIGMYYDEIDNNFIRRFLN